MTKHIGILTAGGDSPGLNAAIRGAGKAGQINHDMRIIGFKDGFRGLVENRTMSLDGSVLSGILTVGGTILGTSRDKPRKMRMGGKMMDMTNTAVANACSRALDCVVCDCVHVVDPDKWPVVRAASRRPHSPARSSSRRR